MGNLMAQRDEPLDAAAVKQQQQVELADCSIAGLRSALAAATAEDADAPLPPLPPELSRLLPKGGSLLRVTPLSCPCSS